MLWFEPGRFSVEANRALLPDTFIVTHVSFETGSDALKEIEEKVYVSAGRFILEEGKPVMVEYKISEVAA